MVAVLPELVVFAAAIHCTAPVPIPVEPDVIESHGALLTAVHCNKGSSVDTDNDALVTSCPILADEGLTLRLPPS